MRKILFLIISCILCSCSIDCKNPTTYLDGNHELRKFKTVTKEGYRMSGSYFLLGGSVHGSSFKEVIISFSFQMPNGDYAMGELPMSKIRVHVDSTIIKPYVKFDYEYFSFYSNGNGKLLQFALDNSVNYMTIYCKEEDFPYDVKMTDL